MTESTDDEYDPAEDANRSYHGLIEERSHFPASGGRKRVPPPTSDAASAADVEQVIGTPSPAKKPKAAHQTSASSEVKVTCVLCAQSTGELLPKSRGAGADMLQNVGRKLSAIEESCRVCTRVCNSKAHARLPDGACRRVSAACAADIADDGVAKYHLGSTSTCSGKKWFMSCEVTSPPVPH
jgi:hypothetical protein